MLNDIQFELLNLVVKIILLSGINIVCSEFSFLFFGISTILNTYEADQNITIAFEECFTIWYPIDGFLSCLACVLLLDINNKYYNEKCKFCHTKILQCYLHKIENTLQNKNTFH